MKSGPSTTNTHHPTSFHRGLSSPLVLALACRCPPSPPQLRNLCRRQLRVSSNGKLCRKRPHFKYLLPYGYDSSQQFQ